MTDSSPPPPPSPSSGYRANPDFSFPSAFQPSIIRSFQKDSYYLSLLRTQVSDVVRSTFGSRFLQVNAEGVTLLAAIAYYVCSTYQGSQTLGEEYVGSRMVRSAGRRFVSNRRRLVFILSQVLLPFLLSRIYAKLRRRLSVLNSVRKQKLQRAQLRFRAVKGADVKSEDEPKPSTLDRVIDSLVKFLPTLEDLQRPDGWLTYATTIHLMLFYLGGRYYKFGQRIARVRYISIHPTRPGQDPPSYEVLGVLLGVQLGVKLAISLNRYLHRRSQQQSKNNKDFVSSQDDSQADPIVTIDGRDWDHSSYPARPALPPNDDAATAAPSDETTPDYSSLAPPGSSVPLLYPSSTSLTPSDPTLNLSSSQLSNLQLQTAPHESTSQSILRCTLCMDSRKPHRGTSVVTECGHLFDWTCIMGWLSEKGECPLCRQTVRVNRVVPIYNI